MTEKLHDYEGWLGRFHRFKQIIIEKFQSAKEAYSSRKTQHQPDHVIETQDELQNTYSHIFRPKTRMELVRISAAVMGIEFSYAAETAFVSPTLLKIGIEHKKMTLIWALSPLVGFFLTPILGSLSDKCNSNMGRRRPFICLLSLGVFLGLLLVPNGVFLGKLFQNEELSAIHLQNETDYLNISTTPTTTVTNKNSGAIFFTVLGTILLDFDADACQSPARSFLLDVTTPEDHARGLSTFTIMAGLGGFLGYGLGGINWNDTLLGELLGGQVRAVFTLISIIFVICVTYTITSFQEIPLYLLNNTSSQSFKTDNESNQPYENIECNDEMSPRTEINYGTVDAEPKNESKCNPNVDEQKLTLSHYLKTIVHMPHSIRMVCLTNLFCWMAHVCYSLYFTDFVGEAVFEGSPKAPTDSEAKTKYESGVRFGCWGMSMYSLSCACYSTCIDRLIKRFGARMTYITGLSTYSIGMLLMALTKSKVGVILFSWTAGVMYSTLFTLPYLLIAHYHSKSIFETTDNGEAIHYHEIRGLGTDVAVVSSMVFLAQFILSLCIGTIITIFNTTTTVVVVASALAFMAAISATKIIYLDL